MNNETDVKGEIRKVKRSKRKFEREFKVKAVRPLIEGTRSLIDVAKELDINKVQLCRWKKEYLEGELTSDTQDTQVMARLNRELKEIRKERDRLKKLLVIVLGEVTR